MAQWQNIGLPFKDMKNKMQYSLTENTETGEIAVNAFNMANAGKLPQVRTTLEEFESTGLPEVVKKQLRKHQKSKH